MGLKVSHTYVSPTAKKIRILEQNVRGLTVRELTKQMGILVGSCDSIPAKKKLGGQRLAVAL